jgi:Cu+-exporting ATPase
MNHESHCHESGDSAATGEERRDQTIHLAVTGASCASCVSKIEKALQGS